MHSFLSLLHVFCVCVCLFFFGYVCKSKVLVGYVTCIWEQVSSAGVYLWSNISNSKFLDIRTWQKWIPELTMGTRLPLLTKQNYASEVEFSDDVPSRSTHAVTLQYSWHIDVQTKEYHVLVLILKWKHWLEGLIFSDDRWTLLIIL